MKPLLCIAYVAALAALRFASEDLRQADSSEEARACRMLLDRALEALDDIAKRLKVAAPNSSQRYADVLLTFAEHLMAHDKKSQVFG
ncbi:MAG TPA: hypothetical protein VK524_08340 [Polyangiaceae bacterium]|nr:hypothetical protein [Polyangiaceae bacterium]